MPASISLFANASPAQSDTPQGAVQGGVKAILRLEGLAIFAAALAAYVHLGAPWPLDRKSVV